MKWATPIEDQPSPAGRDVAELVRAATALDPGLTDRELAVLVFEVYTAGESRWKLAWRVLRGRL